MQARMLRSVAPKIATETMDGSLEDLARHRHTLVVTYRRDRTPVATPVWGAPAGGRLYVRVERGSGKVKRLRRDHRALLAPCTSRGMQLGPPLQASGRVLVGAEEQAAERALADRYGLVRAIFEGAVDLIGVDMCYLEFTPDTGGANPLGPER
jgi:hypothetical protein